MSNDNKKNHEYYIKKDGVVSEVNKKEFDKVKKDLRKENKKYICPNCRVCTCEKIRYTDINICEGVNLATFEKTSGKVNDQHILERDFKVYDCDHFEMFKELAIRGELIIKSEILEISKKIYELLLSDDYSQEELDNLYEQRDLKKQQLQDNMVLEDLGKEESKLYAKYQLELKLQK